VRRVLAAVCLAAGIASADDGLVRIDTRPGVKVGYWMMERPQAAATLVLLPGGEGGIGLKDGAPHSTNFLVRERDRFAAAGFNVAIVGKPSDREDLDLAFRAGPEHVEDLRHVVAALHARYGKPVWLVGTSRGTVSAVAAAIALGDAIAGVVLTSSITAPYVPQAVQHLPLAKIRVPVLVVHHRKDVCPETPALQAPRILEGLTQAPAKKLLVLDGGSGARGGYCQPLHWHGFIGMEQETVDAIADFIRDRRPEPAARGPSPDS
jgi:pimeloyl-ACP methyl ester carboxylesterase